MEMQDARMSCKAILYLLRNKKSIDTELLISLQDYVLSQIITPAQVPEEFDDLQLCVQIMRNENNLVKMSPKMAYSVGALWSAFLMLEHSRKEENEQEKMEELEKKFSSKKYYDLFRILKDNPNIRHKDLAKKSKFGISALSQFMAKTKYDQLYSCLYVGREKYYRIESRGEELFKYLEGKYGHEMPMLYMDDISAETEICYNMSLKATETSFNNSLRWRSLNYYMPQEVNKNLVWRNSDLKNEEIDIEKSKEDTGNMRLRFRTNNLKALKPEIFYSNDY